MFIHEILKTEGLANMASVIRVAVDLLEESYHKQKFFILLLSHIGFDRDAVVKLICKGNDRVVNDNDVF